MKICQRILTTLLCILTPLVIFPSNAASSQITTLKPGTLSVAVTGICTDKTLHHNCWVYQLLTGFAKKHNLKLDLKVVEFNNSWRLPAENIVDITATGITPLPQRYVQGASNSRYYSIVKRGIRIHKEDQSLYKSINDFAGLSVGVVKGMTSEIDLRRRAPETVNIVAAETWEEVYRLFNSGNLQGIAEGFYVFGDNAQEKNDDESTLMIDAHDLEEGKVEGNTMVVRDKSQHLLDALNDYIKDWKIPESENERVLS